VRARNFAWVSRGIFVACDAGERGERKGAPEWGGPQGPAAGLYRRIIAKDDSAVRDFVLDKIILAPGNEVTLAR